MGNADLAHHFAGRRVLVTGGLGFIGSNLARRLVRLGAQVVLVDAMIPHHGGNYFNVDDVRDRLTIVEADIRDQPRLSSLVREQDLVFNLAGQVAHIDSMNDPFMDLEINCRAQLALMEACRWHNPTVKVVYASTRQVYGRPEYVPADEHHPTRPTDVNGINKIAGERYHNPLPRGLRHSRCCASADEYLRAAAGAPARTAAGFLFPTGCGSPSRIRRSRSGATVVSCAT